MSCSLERAQPQRWQYFCPCFDQIAVAIQTIADPIRPCLYRSVCGSLQALLCDAVALAGRTYRRLTAGWPLVIRLCVCVPSVHNQQAAALPLQRFTIIAVLTSFLTLACWDLGSLRA